MMSTTLMVAAVVMMMPRYRYFSETRNAVYMHHRGLMASHSQAVGGAVRCGIGPWRRW